MDTEAGDGNVDEAARHFDRKDDRRPWKMMPEEVRVFSYADIPVKLCYFCRNFSSEICYLPKKPG